MIGDSALVPFDLLLKQALLGQPTGWPDASQAADRARFLELTYQHGIQPLLYHQLVETCCLGAWPEDISIALKNESALQTIFQAMLARELRQVLASLAAIGVFPLLMKGTPLAYTHYPAPYLRPHCDTDLLFQTSDLDNARNILTELGYAPSGGTTGELVSHQVTYLKEFNPGIRYQLDLHWKIANPQLFSDTLTFAELEQRSVRVPALGTRARALGAAHALLLACMHRVAHHYDDAYLLWVYDIHLLASGLSRVEFEEFARLAAGHQLRAICRRGLELARRWFDTQLPDDLVQRWLAQADDAPAEASERFIAPNLRRLDVLRSDLGQLRGWRKAQLLKEILFPPADYMLRSYSRSSRLLLPALYLHRALLGVGKFLRRRPAL